LKRNDAILRLLRRADGFLSGAELGAALGISRAALWKRVGALRDKGFLIEGSSGRGYRLLGSPGFSPEELRESLKGGLGREIVFHGQTTSTNETAMALASGGAPHGTVVVADSQSGGKGRLGRKWASPPGCNIYMSVILRPSIPPRDAPLLTLLAAVSSALALRRATGIEAMIKWPNDIVARGRKIGGVLLEMRGEPDRVAYAVLGVGINVNMKRKALPVDVRPHATSVLEETGGEYPRAGLMAGVLDELSSGLDALEKEGAAPLIGKCRELSSTLRKRVRVKTGSETFTGTALDMDHEGRLLVRTQKGEVRRVSSGDVEMLRAVRHSSPG
jgi:BirA family biotin operon repressor/biotin-[acetyl-CoA-carboxylase] ligase